MSRRRGGRFGLPALLFALLALPSARGAETPAAGAGDAPELVAAKARLQAMMREEGLGPENWYLRGQFVSRIPQKTVPSAYPEEGFPYRWDFNDGTLCGINGQGQMENVRVEGGVLKAATSGKDAFLSWGDFDGKGVPLHFGFPTRDGYTMPTLAAVTVRLRQTPADGLAVWQAAVHTTAASRGGAREVLSREAVVQGTAWQDVVLVFKDVPSPPYTGFKLMCRTAETPLEIDAIVPNGADGLLQYRRAIDIPARVRWARCSIVSETFHRLYVNGRLAVRSPPYVRCAQMWNYDLDPALFHVGRNMLAEENSMWFGSGFILDGALLCEDGTYVRFDSDTNWMGRVQEPAPGTDWRTAGADDGGWGPVGAYPNHPNAPSVYENLLGWQQGNAGVECRAWWFNPSWKGRLMAASADGRDQPVFGSREQVSLRVAAPRRVGETNDVTYQVFGEMGDGFRAADRLVREGKLELKVDVSGVSPATGGTAATRSADGEAAVPPDGKQPSEIRSLKPCRDDVGVLTFPAGTLPSNVAYAVVFRLNINGAEVEKYRYELAVCGPVAQPVVENPKNYTDGMELKLVWERDAAAEQNETEFISCSGDATRKPSRVVETPLGRFRCTYDGPDGLKSAGGSLCHFMSFKYAIANPGRPHVAIAEYPDDAQRVQEMRISENAFWGAMSTKGNDTAVLGIEQPLTHEIRQLHCVFFPNQTTGTVTFFAMQVNGSKWNRDMAARVGKIRIYEILNDVPMRKIADAPGPAKWIGQQPEAGPRQVMQSCHASPLGPLIRGNLSHSERPNFYQSWMVTYLNMVKRLRFAGENAYHYGQFMYDQVLYPSVYSDHTAMEFGYSGSLKDSGALMAKLFEENGLGWFSGLEMVALSRVKEISSEAEIAAGADTMSAISRDGRQYAWQVGVYPNWIHPDVRKHFETVINELIALYGQWPGWKGITLQVNEELGPCWVTFDGTPYFASYDDYTIGLFEKETKVRIPVEPPFDSAQGGKDPQRFRKRHDWLMANAKKEWTDWRCAKLNEIYDWMKKRLKETRKDLKFVLFTNGNSLMNPRLDDPNPLPSFHDYARQAGIDIGRLVNDPDVICSHTVQAEMNYPEVLSGKVGDERYNRFGAHRDDFLSSLSNDGKNGITVRYNWYEPQPSSPEDWPWWHLECGAEAWPVPAAEYFGDYWCNILIRCNPTLVVHSLQDVTMWMGRETSMGRYTHAFRSVPIGRYERLRGNGRDVNVWIETTRFEKDTWGYVANPDWWTVDARVELKPGITGTDLIAGQEIKGGAWRLKLAPYEIRTFRLDRAGPEAIMACGAAVSEKGREFVKAMIAGRARTLNDALQAAQTESESVVKEIHDTGYPALATSMVQRAEALAAANDYSGAYELFTASADFVRFGRMQNKVTLVLEGYDTADQTYRGGGERLSKKDYEGARRYFRQALRKNDPAVSVDAQMGIAYSYSHAGQWMEAKPEFLKVLAMPLATADQRATALANLFNIARDTEKKPEEAKKYAEQSRIEYLKCLDDPKAHDHTKTMAVYLLGYGYVSGSGFPELKDVEKALPIYKRIDEQKTPHPGYLPRVYEGWIQTCLELKKYAEAREVADKILKIRGLDADSYARAWFAIGDAYKGESNKAKAKESYAAALAVQGISDGTKSRGAALLKECESVP